MDFWIALAALIVAACGPLITALITAKHESFMYKTKYVDEHKHEVVEKYLKSVGRFLFSLDHNDLKEFGASSSEIFMYAPKNLWDDIKKINEAIFKISSCSDYEEKKNLCKKSKLLFYELCENFADFSRKEQRKKRKNKNSN